MADTVTFGSISHGQMSFHNWLIQSRYVNGEDDAQGRRRKGKARSTKGEEHDPRNAQAHSHAVIASSLMLPPDALPLSGKRKARRWVNERLLKDMAGPLTGPDVTSLYAPPPWGEKTERPVLERLSDVAVATPFEAFVCQQYLAGATFNKLPSRKARSKQSREQASSSTQHPAAAAGGGAGAAVAASQAAWRRVPEAARGAMRRAAGWVVVGTIEALLVAFLQPPPAAAAATTVATSSTVDEYCSGRGELSSEDGRGDGSSTVSCTAGVSGDGGMDGQQQQQMEMARVEGGEGVQEGSGSGIGSVLPEWCVQAAWGDVESALEAHGGKLKGGVRGGAGAAEGEAERGGAGRGGEGRQVLVFAADDAFLRLLLHGMCQVGGWCTACARWVGGARHVPGKAGAVLVFAANDAFLRLLHDMCQVGGECMACASPVIFLLPLFHPPPPPPPVPRNVLTLPSCSQPTSPPPPLLPLPPRTLHSHRHLASPPPALSAIPLCLPITSA
ncbi:unnamed protein product [Closterium sp. NIES-53]